MCLLPALRQVDLLQKPGSHLELVIKRTNCAQKSTIKDPDLWLPVRAVRILTALPNRPERKHNQILLYPKAILTKPCKCVCRIFPLQPEVPGRAPSEPLTLPSI